MALTTIYCSPEEVVSNAECLLGHVGKARGVLWRKGFSEYAIDQAVMAVYRAAMPYINGTKLCLIENRRAWVFKVAIRAASRAAEREVRCRSLEPAILMAPEDRGEHETPFDIRDVLSQLTEQQSSAVTLCILGGKSHRDAARSMDIRVGTLCRHLRAAKHRLSAILAPYAPKEALNNPELGAGARAS
jgi:DNA-directed RNA polymerase specialized sigma24 family protein